MAIRQTYLDWNEPCLPQAANWVLSQKREATQDLASQADLSDFILVVSGARAGRRLLEILVERTVGRAMTPPRIITLNQLPELLYASDLPRIDDLSVWLYRAQAIHATPLQELAVLLPHPPKEDDAIGQLTLAQEIQKIADELASHQLTFASVASQITSLMDFDDHQRWDVLASIDERYHQLLSDRGLTDTNRARASALQAATEQSASPQQSAPSPASIHLKADERIALIATTDLPPVAMAMLRQLNQLQDSASAQDDAQDDALVDVLIHAPSDQAQGFDELGRLDPSWWEPMPTELAPQRVHLMDRPADQAYHIATLISQMGNHDEPQSPLPRPDQITVGLGDQTMAPQITRTLACTGVPTRHAAGKLINQSSPAVLLQNVAVLLTRHTTRELAQSLRCPAIEARVRSEMGVQGNLLLTHLDQYINAHLTHRLSDAFLEDEPDPRQPADEKPASESPSKTVMLAWQTMLNLLPKEWDSPRPLSQWCEPIAQILQTFFGQRDLQRFDPDDAVLIRAIQAMANALGQQADAPSDLSVLDKFTLPQAIQLLLIQIAGQLLPPESGEPAIELLGWLELQLDDAPHLIIAGFNEGNVPQHSNNHWLLPDTLRQKLGLPDNRHRYVRELYMLKAMIHSRSSVDLIAGRHSQKGEPLTPSRLLLASNPDELPQWILKFYDTRHNSPRAPLLMTPGKTSTFDVPRPMPLDRPITNLSVTAFRDYIACPYRFYLKHVLRLRQLDDTAVEMDAMSFGNMAHDVLQQFAQSSLIQSSDADSIADFLASTLQSRIQNKFGSKPPAVIHIQQEILQQRLARFAAWQAGQTAMGWKLDVKLTERKLQTILDVDGQPFTIHGRIDRCDHLTNAQADQQTHRLLDYKTGDAHHPPEKTHRKRDGTWLDLQLPLYHELARSLNLQGQIELGYFNLPKDLNHVGHTAAEWDEHDIESAVDTAREIIRKIREEKFWPPTIDPRDDEFAGICMDHVLNKAQDELSENVTGANA